MLRRRLRWLLLSLLVQHKTKWLPSPRRHLRRRRLKLKLLRQRLESKGEAKGDAKSEAKAKAEKARGDIGLLDTEKNYLILVTKEGKLITLDYDAKTKATQIDPTPSKMADIGLGSSATVEYTKQGDKNIAKSVEFTPAKGGD